MVESIFTQTLHVYGGLLKNHSTFLRAFIILSSATAIVGCGSTIGGGSAPALNISGSLNVGNSAAVAQKLGLNFSTKSIVETDESVSAESVDLSQYKVACFKSGSLGNWNCECKWTIYY
jgi:hypothetical protein